MRFIGIIHDDALEEYTSKRGATAGQTVRTRLLTLQDASTEGPRLKQFCDVVVPDDFPIRQGDAIGTHVFVDVTEITFFSGRPRFRGMVHPGESK